jgi:flagellar motor switch protein FliN/FliY
MVKDDPMAFLEGIEIEVAAVLGSTMLPIREIVKMSRGAMIPLDCRQDDPTLLLVNQQPIARGLIQVEGDRMSIEVTEILRATR